jgi:hypothetical protein
MRPKTADERERRFVQYMLTLNKGQLGEVRLRRMNRIANFRHDLMRILNQLIEERAEDLAAAMLMEHAPVRPIPEWEKEAAARKFVEGRLLVPEQNPIERKKRRMPIWVRKAGETARRRGARSG